MNKLECNAAYFPIELSVNSLLAVLLGWIQTLWTF
jgi:hypothetical protein